MVSPDFDGFQDAQVKLRAEFGHEVVFFTPIPSIYPPGTQINPETKRPYDPTIRPLGSGFSSAAVEGSIVHRPLGLSRSGTGDSQVATAIGNMGEGDVVVILGSGSVSAASGATLAHYLNQEYKVTDFLEDELGPVRRCLAFLEERK